MTTAIDGYATAEYVFKGKLILERYFAALKKAVISNNYREFSIKTFEKKVSNHFPLTTIFYLKISLVRRFGTLTYALTGSKISPVIIGIFQKKLMLLDGNHRSVAAAISNSKIRALMLDFRK